MRTETDPVTGMQAGAAALGAEERSDEAGAGSDINVGQVFFVCVFVHEVQCWI